MANNKKLVEAITSMETDTDDLLFICLCFIIIRFGSPAMY